jgi:hypothetical protein
MKKLYIKFLYKFFTCWSEFYYKLKNCQGYINQIIFPSLNETAYTDLNYVLKTYPKVLWQLFWKKS